MPSLELLLKFSIFFTFLQFPVPKDQVHAITDTQDTAAAASQYEETMKRLAADGTLQKAGE